MSLNTANDAFKALKSDLANVGKAASRIECVVAAFAAYSQDVRLSVGLTDNTAGAFRAFFKSRLGISDKNSAEHKAVQRAVQRGLLIADEMSRDVVREANSFEAVFNEAVRARPDAIKKFLDGKAAKIAQDKADKEEAARQEKIATAAAENEKAERELHALTLVASIGDDPIHVTENATSEDALKAILFLIEGITDGDLAVAATAVNAEMRKRQSAIQAATMAEAA